MTNQLYSPLYRDSLHFKPLTAYLGRGIFWVTTTLQRGTEENTWRGKVIYVFSKALLLVGTIGTFYTGIIETVAFSALSGISLLFNSLFCKNQSYFLQKHTLRALSHAIHSLIVPTAFLILLTKQIDLKFYSIYVILDHAMHLFSAGLVQLTSSRYLDRLAGRANPQLPSQRVVHLLSENLPSAIRDVSSQLNREFGETVSLQHLTREIPSLSSYLDRYPDDRRFLEQFNLQSLRNPEQRTQAVAMIRRFLTEAGIIRPHRRGNADPLLVEIHQVSASEAAYQDRLAHLLKGALLEIYRDDHLSNCLNQQDISGKELLEGIDGSTFGPLTAYTQYKELLEPIQCPEAFTENRAQYNSRKKTLLEVRPKVMALGPEEKQVLVQKILTGGGLELSDELKPKLQPIYLDITNLAAPLFQGPLMTKTSLNFGDINHLVQAENLFNKAYMEALAEIG